MTGRCRKVRSRRNGDAVMTLGRNDRKRKEVEEAGVTGGGNDRKVQDYQEQEGRWQR